VLDRQPNGDCIFLGPTGCEVHGAAPEICRRFDCRVLYLLTPADQQAARVAQNAQMGLVYAAGAARLAEPEIETCR
jgi:Fe-S-cluster containining protein